MNVTLNIKCQSLTVNESDETSIAPELLRRFLHARAEVRHRVRALKHALRTVDGRRLRQAEHNLNLERNDMAGKTPTEVMEDTITEMTEEVGVLDSASIFIDAQPALLQAAIDATKAEFGLTDEQLVRFTETRDSMSASADRVKAALNPPATS